MKLPGETPDLMMSGNQVTRRDLLSTFHDGAVIDGKYRIESQLGTGSMGTVFVAVDEKLERKVAIKVLSGVAGSTDEGQRLFRQEAIAMAQVRHPNIVQVFSAGRHEQYPYLAMEYVEGTDLESYLISVRRPHLDVVLGILKQVAGGLDAIHAKGLVHRDVKPGNILIGKQYKVQLIDFGLVDLARGAWAGTISGTPGYMAPEYIRLEDLPEEQRHYGDIYALGVCAFELLTGRLPYDSEDPKVTLADHLKKPPPALSEFVDDLPVGFDDAVLRAMSKTATERWPTCSSFVSALQSARNEAVAKLPGTGIRILAVDDDVDQQELYQIIFDAAFGEGTLFVAGEGLTAMELIRANRPSLIILDLNMPCLNGIELVSLLARNPAWAAIPIVVISGEASEANRELLHALGVREVRQKPVPPKELVELARTLVRNS